MTSTDDVGSDPLSWTRHAHRRGVRRPVSAAQLVVLVSFGLKATGACLTAAPAVVLSQPLVAVEKVDVGVRCEIDVPAHTRDPHQQLRRHQVQM